MYITNENKKIIEDIINATEEARMFDDFNDYFNEIIRPYGIGRISSNVRDEMRDLWINERNGVVRMKLRGEEVYDLEAKGLVNIIEKNNREGTYDICIARQLE